MKINNHLSDFIRELYKSAYKTPLSEFKNTVFELTNELIAFKSSIWITRSQMGQLFLDAETATYQLPDRFMDNYIRNEKVTDMVLVINNHLLKHHGKMVDINDIIPTDKWKNSEFYIHHCQKYDIEYSVMSIIKSTHNNINNIITFTRSNDDQSFSEEERKLLEFIMPHYAEALRVNILNSFKNTHQNVASFRAVVDYHGTVMECEEGFESLLSENNIYVADNKIPLSIVEKNQSSINGITFTSESYDGLVYVNAQFENLKLSKRKKEVCQLLIAGHSNKVIAKHLNISPETVNYHVKEINKLLKVNTRHQAIAYLSRQDLS